MQIFVNALRRTVTCNVEAAETIGAIKARIEEIESIPASEQGLYYGGKPLSDDLTLAECSISDLSTLHLNLELLGGGKKRKKKVYTTPKKIKHKHKKVKLAVLKFYKVDESGKITRNRVECNSATCGGGVFMADHGNRHYCGKCHNTLVQQGSAKTGGKKK
uniref:Ubiquitin-like domain-containing protein n=1 Tax=Parastrongyloides trichosuri TaxID=131310 RepID=A0A0N4ZXZ9_PARTI